MTQLPPSYLQTKSLIFVFMGAPRILALIVELKLNYLINFNYIPQVLCARVVK